MTDIFVSYSRKDSATARKLFETFKAHDLNPWVDWEDIPPAVDWLDQIFQGIEKSDAFIFLIGPDSAISEVCKVEIAHAAKNNKRIIPILVRDVEPKTVIQTIRDLNWIYLRENDNFEEGLEKIKVGITLDIEWVSAHRRLQVLALEWDRRKDPSLLLHGGDLRNARALILSAQNKEPKLTPLQQTFIEYSNQDERRKFRLRVSVAVALLIMAVLSFTTAYQARRATENAALAQTNERIAQENAANAIQNERIARDLQKLAEVSENIAEAQRSAARAQIYQFRPGQLYTSTLLAIDSLQRNPTIEVEQILRKNISYLPIPIASVKQNSEVLALALNPVDDSYLTASADGEICVWMFRAGESKFCVSSAGAVEAAEFSPDGKKIVAGNQAGQVLIINAETGKIEKTFNYETPIWDVSISPNGELIAVARDDETITIINLPKQIFNYDLFTFGSIRTVKFSPNSMWIASGTDKGITTIWNVSNGNIISGPIHQGQVFEVEFSPDSRLMLSSGSDSVANLNITANGATLFRILNEDWVQDVAFNSDGAWFVTVSNDSRIRVWDSKSGKEKLRILQESFINQIKISPNDQWIATTGHDKTVRIWSAATGAEIFQIPLKSVGNLITFSADGNYIISAEQNGDINTWDISSLANAINYIPFDSSTHNLQFSSSNWFAASTTREVWVLNFQQPTSLTLTEQDSPAIKLNSDSHHLVASPDANWLAISQENGEVILYNVINKTTSVITATEGKKNIIFSANSKNLFIGDSQGKVSIFDIEKNDSTELVDVGSGVSSLALFQNQLAIGLQNKIIIFDLDANQVVSEIDSPGDHALMSINSDGSILATSNSTGQISIWKLRGSQFNLQHTIPSEQVFVMTFNPQGDQLFVGVQNNVYILDPNTGGELGRIRHKDNVNGLSFSADGSVLATASLRVVQFWDAQRLEIISPEEIESAACSRLLQNFDAAQWNSFFGDDPYRSLCSNLPVP